MIYQEIPNDPKSKKPYVHFHHSFGSIVIEPYLVDGKILWQFSPNTLSNISNLFNEMEHVQSAYPTKIIEDNNFYFTLKKVARNISPLQIAIFASIFLYGAHHLGLSNVLFSIIKSPILITSEMIDNYSAREAMRMDTEFFFSLNTSKSILDAIDSKITEYLKANKSVNQKKIILVGVNDYTKIGISFGVSFFVKASTETEYSTLRHRIITELANIIKEHNIELVMIKQEASDIE